MTDLLLILGSCVVIILFCIWYTVAVLLPIEKEVREGEQEKKPRLRIMKSEYPEHQLSFNAWQWWLANRK